jgi:hypothetical protein
VSLTLETKKVTKGSAAAGGVMPVWAKIPTVTAISGLSKSKIYLEAARGKIILKKDGRATLVNVPSALDYVASLPDAVLSPPRDDRGAPQK